VLVLLSAAACGGAPTVPSASPTAAATVSSVTVTGGAPSVGGIAQLVAVASLSDGTSQVVTAQASWSSSSLPVASVSPSGLVTGVGPGEADVIATYQGVSGRVHLSIAPPIVTTPTCSYSLSIGTTIDGYPGGGLFPVTVTTMAGCAWSVSTTTSWVHVPAPPSGTGTGSFTFTVDANSGAARTGTLSIAGKMITFNQSAVASVPAPNPPFAGIRFDNIQLPHTFIIGSPVPTQNQSSTYCCWPLPVTNSGTFTYRLSDFPLDVLPSGGSSNVASASEMLFVGVNVSPASTVMRFEWHKAVAQDSVIYTFTTSSAFAWAYSFIGHFSWEINEPGAYYLLIDTPSGGARIDFAITGPTPTLTRLGFGQPVRAGGFQTGGFGAGRD
jgi:hypothetical protein